VPLLSTAGSAHANDFDNRLACVNWTEAHCARRNEKLGFVGLREQDLLHIKPKFGAGGQQFESTLAKQVHQARTYCGPQIGL